MAGGVVSKLGPTIPQCRFVGDGRNRFKIAANNLGPVGNGGPGSRRYPFPALTYRQNRGNEHGDEILRTWPSSEACGGRLVPSSQRPHASEATWLSRLPCVDTRQQGRFGRVQLRLRRMPECRSEPPLSCEEGCMTNHLRRARGLSLRYALAELQRCQDLLRLSRDNIRTAMRQSPELPSGVAGPRAAPRPPYPPRGPDRP
jgi:hypothetical protein